MRDKLWINRWTERRKESAVSNAKQGISFLGGYNMTDYKNVLFELCVGLNMYKGSPTSCYSNIIPPNGSEVIKVRLSDHRSTENEWGQNELTGYPNRRYSIVIFSMKSMPDESKQDIVETEWQSYLSNGIPVYEKCFNRFYLKDTFPKLISILQDIYSGGEPEDNTIRVDLTENKQHKTRYNMKKTIRLSESDLHRVIKESLRRMLKEGHYEDDERYDNSYRECLRLLTAAKESLITDFRNDTGYNENDPYYADLSNKHNSIIEKIDKAISECEEVALGGRIGTYDSENGYTPNPHLGGWNGEYNGIGY